MTLTEQTGKDHPLAELRETANRRQDKPERTQLWGIPLDCVSLNEAVELARHWFRAKGGCCRYVVTPNTDHIVQIQDDSHLLHAYRHADLVVADGWPVVVAARLLGLPVPERVAGSDFVPKLIAAGIEDETLRVFLLGAAPGVAERAAARIHADWPHARVVGLYSPPNGFESDLEQTRLIIHRINQTEPHLLVLGLGTPKQEIWLDRFAADLKSQVAVAAGATIDFLAGEQKRAPRWMQRFCLEWFYRVARNPRRLGHRYLRDAWIFPRLVAREYVSVLRHRGVHAG